MGTRQINCSVGARALGPQAPVEYELPIEAVTEAVVNAVAHRDYASNATVQVMLFADRLEVWNPGGLPPSLTPERLREPHASTPRNPLVAESLYLARYIEKCSKARLPAPVEARKKMAHKCLKWFMVGRVGGGQAKLTT